MDEAGVIRILGLWNGLTTTITNETGSDKPSMNGYKLTMTGKEDNQAYFIEDLTLAGIFIYNTNNYIFEDGCNYVFEDGNNFIYN